MIRDVTDVMAAWPWLRTVPRTSDRAGGSGTEAASRGGGDSGALDGPAFAARPDDVKDPGDEPKGDSP